MRRAMALGAIVLVGVAGLVGCDDDESQAAAEDNLCASLTSFSSSVVNLQGLDPATASQDDYEAAVQEIEKAGNTVREDAEDVSDADTAALESAVNDLEAAADDVPDDVPVADAVSTLQPEVQAVAQTWNEAFNGLGCQTSTSSSNSQTQ